MFEILWSRSNRKVLVLLLFEAIKVSKGQTISWVEGSEHTVGIKDSGKGRTSKKEKEEREERRERERENRGNNFMLGPTDCSMHY